MSQRANRLDNKSSSLLECEGAFFVPKINREITEVWGHQIEVKKYKPI